MPTPQDTPTKATRAKPQDHLPARTGLRKENLDEPVTFTFDGEQFTVTPSDATGLEFLAALEDTHIIKALRLLLGEEQAARLIKGRKIADAEHFFDVLGDQVGMGNP